jgi:hypothetical protein
VLPSRCLMTEESIRREFFKWRLRGTVKV